MAKSVAAIRNDVDFGRSRRDLQHLETVDSVAYVSAHAFAIHVSAFYRRPKRRFEEDRLYRHDQVGHERQRQAECERPALFSAGGSSEAKQKAVGYQRYGTCDSYVPDCIEHGLASSILRLVLLFPTPFPIAVRVESTP
jgi:hypothetical protein